MLKRIIFALVVVVLGAGVGFFVYKSEPRLNKNFAQENAFFQKYQFRLGLDLSGGTHLVYEADVSGVSAGQEKDAMAALRDVVERRVNIFGVSEPVVQVQNSSLVSGAKEQLIVDLPGVTDVEQAVAMIGRTPVLQFKTEAPEGTPIKVKPGPDGTLDLSTIDLSGPQYEDTELTGRYLERATLQFDPNTREPLVALKFNAEGTELFAEITKNNIGKTVAIYLDGELKSNPVVREEIPTGEAYISGSFNPEEARQLVRDLNLGALPVPIKLASTQTIGPILGENAVDAGIRATIIGFLLVALLLVVWYRLPGVVAVISLSIFVVIMLAIFKLIPVTLTAAGVAGFIISIGVAVDANVLVFERMKEQMRAGENITGATQTGFSRAWFSIRDSNMSGLITAVILFWFGTSLIKGFALTLGLGIFVSLLCAVTIMRILLRVFNITHEGKTTRFLFGSGLSK